MFVLDTDILIDFLKGREPAVNIIRGFIKFKPVWHYGYKYFRAVLGAYIDW